MLAGAESKHKKHWEIAGINVEFRGVSTALGITNIWCVARFGIICTILKTWKTGVLHLVAGKKSTTLIKITLLHGCFSCF